jgi:hypothetical protein
MAKRKKAVELPPADFGDFLLVNHDKLDRVINGVVGEKGKLTGGIGKDAAPEAILAEYDKLGGLVLHKATTKELNEDGELVEQKRNLKVATGAFYDFENEVARKEPRLTYVKAPNSTGAPQIVVVEVGDSEKKMRKGRTKKQIESDGE